jgi:hypothetical protein
VLIKTNNLIVSIETEDTNKNTVSAKREKRERKGKKERNP